MFSKKHLRRLHTLDGGLFDSARGGEFEVKGQKLDPERVVKIVKKSNEMRALIRYR